MKHKRKKIHFKRAHLKKNVYMHIEAIKLDETMCTAPKVISKQHHLDNPLCSLQFSAFDTQEYIY